jgi:hypothetical protein
MEDDVFVDKDEVTLDLCVEGIGNVDAAYISGSWANPHPADLTGVTYLFNKV